METTFYDDYNFRKDPGEDIKMKKRNMTLDLDSPKPTKRQKCISFLTSPDLNMLKLASPELEKFIIAQNGLVTTTPTPTQFFFPKNVTEEQEQYARGFVDALAQLHQATAPSAGSIIVQHVTTEGSAERPLSATTISTTCTTLPCRPTTVPVSYPSVTSLTVRAPSTIGATELSDLAPESTVMTTLSDDRPPSTSESFPGVTSSYINPIVTIKEEPQTVPSLGGTPPLSPIDMEDQERIKLERKRLRNRIAASKCRKRKLERIARLEDKVRILKGENTELGTVVNKLREQVCQLKQQVMDHVKSGCQIMITNVF